MCFHIFLHFVNLFKYIFTAPTIIIPGLNKNLLEPLMGFMYTGETYVSSNSLSNFLEMCSFLKVKGFIQVNGIQIQQEQQQQRHSEKLPGEYNKVSMRQPIKKSKSNIEELNIVTSNEDIKHEDESTLNDTDNCDHHVEEVYIIEDTVHTTDDGIEEMRACNEEEIIGTEEYLDMDMAEEDGLAFTTSPSADNKIKTKSLFIPPIDMPQRLIKNYTEEDLAEALEQLKKGECSVMEISEKCNVPRSTIYMKLRQHPEYRLLYRSLRNSVIEDAVRAVNTVGMSLREASLKFNISKTALWRRLKKSEEYKPEERTRVQRTDAMQAISRGETLISVSKQYNIPLSTLHRDKVRLFNSGKLPTNCTLAKRDRGPTYKTRLEEAVICCENGMTQKLASELHSVPKTTIWRHLQQRNKAATNTINQKKLLDITDEKCILTVYNCTEDDVEVQDEVLDIKGGIRAIDNS